jgi:hypothetical protein
MQKHLTLLLPLEGRKHYNGLVPKSSANLNK